MSPAAWILLQGFAGIAGGVILLRWAMPAVRQLAAERPREAAGLAATWLPLAVVLPSVVAASRFAGGAAIAGAGEGAAGAAGSAAAVGVGGGLVAAGLAVAVGRREAGSPAPASPGIDRVSLVAAGVAGMLLVVLAASRHLDVWSGQVAFAAMALLLWLGGPPPRPRGEPPSPSDARCGFALLAAVLVAGVEAAAVRGALADEAGGGGALARAAAGVLAVKSVVVLAGLAVGLPESLGRRIGVWTMVIAACGAAGVATLTRLPALVAGAVAGGLPPGPIVAGGFGAWAPEAGCLLAAAALVILPSRTAPRRVLGAAAAVTGLAVLAGWA